jgi:menaquinone-dependent protoporphyrinogen IX oxidase
MAKTVNPIFQLYPAYFNDKEFTSVNNLSKAFLTESEWLSPVVTHAFGSSAKFGKRNFPLTFITEGMGNTQSIGSADGSYKMAVIGKPKKTSMILLSSYVAGEKPGRGHTKFKAVFADRWFYKSQSIYSPSRLECRIQSEPRQAQGGWEYELKVMNPSAEAYVPVSDLMSGSVWGRGVAKVGRERSRGVESRTYSPYQITNQLSIVRHSHKYAGNVKNKVMVLEIKADGETFRYWTQWDLFLGRLDFKEQCESDLWYSTYNKDANGVIHVEDEDSGEYVPSGGGALQQIPNYDTYSYLTTKKIETLVTDIFFNASDADTVNVEIYTGTGGLREASRAMENASKGFTLVDSIYVKKGGGDMLQFGAYFNVYKHIDGHTVTFKKLPMMDKGVMADISPLHPTDQLPLESFNMYCIDSSTYEGQNNIQYVSEKGRESIEKIVNGMIGAPGYNDSIYASTDIDASSIEFMKSQGIQFMRPTNCFKLFCQIS